MQKPAEYEVVNLDATNPARYCGWEVVKRYPLPVLRKMSLSVTVFCLKFKSISANLPQT